MVWRDPEFWNDLSQIAPILLILLSALAGEALFSKIINRLISLNISMKYFPA